MYVTRCWCPVIVALFGVLLVSPQSWADDAPQQDSVAQWIQQLGSPSFTKRQLASRALEKKGLEAVEPLAKVAQGTNRESTTRAIDVLRRLSKGDDTKLNGAATAALKKLAKSDNPVASRLAAAALAPPKPEPKQDEAKGNPFGQLPPAIQQRLGGIGRIQIQGQVANRAIKVKTVNGVKEIEAKEDNRTVKIVDDPDKGIQMEVIEEKDGKQVSQKYTAKNADELKKKHPKAHELYEKYNKQNQRIVVQLQQIPGAGGRILIRPQLLPAGPIQRQPKRQSLKNAEKELQDAIKQLKDISIDGEAAKQLKESIERLEKARQHIEKSLK